MRNSGAVDQNTDLMIYHLCITLHTECSRLSRYSVGVLSGSVHCGVLDGISYSEGVNLWMAVISKVWYCTH